jgi:diguanylate cyclase (GGDEF)-like protein
VILRKRSEDEVRTTKNALEVANRELQIALEREKKLSHTDSLTGVNNRRYLFELAEREFNIATRHQLPLTVMLFDIDHFKKVNDTFGHDIGDAVLQRVVAAACAELRSSDVIGRYGGEEFVIVLPMTTAQQAHPVAERIRARVEALRVPTHKKDASATLSLGIVELTRGLRDTASIDDLIRHADEAMYAAKQAGRNRIFIFEE